MSDNATAALELEPPRPRGRPRAEDLAELEARLVRVARQCFVAKGYGATSMSEVARAARVSKGTLYSRFGSKADLFRAIIDAQIRETGSVVRPPDAKPRTLEAALLVFAEHALEEGLSAETLQLNRLIYSEAARFPELGEAAWARSRAGVQRVSELIVEYAALEGVPCRAPDAAAEMFTTLLRGFYSDMMLRGQAATMAEIRTWTRRMLEVFLAGRRGW